MLNTVQALNLALRFGLEICVLLAFGNWGFFTGQSITAKVSLGIGFPLITAVVWFLFGAPQSWMELYGFYHVLLELLLFGGAALALWSANRSMFAVVFIVVVIVNRILMYVWNQ